jgi:hypothetical protein
VASVLANVRSVKLADGAGISLRGIGCTHDLAIVSNGIVTLENGDEDR